MTGPVGRHDAHYTGADDGVVRIVELLRRGVHRQALDRRRLCVEQR